MHCTMKELIDIREVLNQLSISEQDVYNNFKRFLTCLK